MDGFFMKKLMKNIGMITLLLALIWCGGVLADKEFLHEDVLRLRIAAHTNSAAREQELLIRDAVVNYLQENVCLNGDIDTVIDNLQAHLTQITYLANRVIQNTGASENVIVRLEKEPFEMCAYDMFILPSGVYESLQIIIGEGRGDSWRCVVFPVSCISATVKEFYDTALASGMGKSLADALIGNGNSEIRLLVLEYLGRLENIFFRI